MGFAEDRRDVEKATRDFKLATVQMGLSEQARDEASAQAILLKKYDLSADVIKELNKDTKLNQIRGLMGLGVSEEDAIGYVFKGKDPSVFMEKFQRYKGMGTGDAFATFLASSTQGILETLRDSPALAERIANGIIAEKGADALTKTDKELLGLDPDFGVKERVDP
jgi:phosphotransferase system HPr-like phosphotransfer protein